MKKKKIFGNTLKEQLKASANDRIYNFLAANDTIRGVIINGTRMVNEMRSNHELGILETLVLGHAYIGCGLLSTGLKGSSDRLTLQIDCSGPIKGLVVETNAFNEVRGYLKNVPIPLDKPLESFDLSPFFGPGFLCITKYIDNKKPFKGQVSLDYGNLAQDLTNYFYMSEQIPTSIALSVHFDTQGNVTGAGGLLLQAMPDADQGVMKRIENRIRNLPSLGEAFSNDKKPEGLIQSAFDRYSPRFLGSRRIEFLCHCSIERMISYLTAMPRTDINDILDNGPFPLEIRCHHCNTVYQIGRDALLKVYQRKSGDA